jgi:hypothetical protein
MNLGGVLCYIINKKVNRDREVHHTFHQYAVNIVSMTIVIT